MTWLAPAALTHREFNAVSASALQALAAGEVQFDFSAAQQLDSTAVALVIALQRQAQQTQPQASIRTVLPENLHALLRLYDVPIGH